MNKLRLLAAASLFACATPNAFASDLTVADPTAVKTLPTDKAMLAAPDKSNVQTRITYTTAAAVAANKTNGAYTGVGSLFIEFESTAVTGYGSLCTGSLLSSNVVLTAAHCIANDPGDAVTSVTLFLPSFGEASVNNIFQAASWQVNPGYNGDATAGGDFGLITLSELVTGRDIYEIYQGNPIGQFTRVGTGTVGGPMGTGTGGVANDYAQRSGSNLYEYYGSLVQGWGSDILLSDFDDGTATHDVFGRLLSGGSQRGIAGESNSSGGDSGGPNFINGQIVAVTSFGISGDAFRANGYCGGFAGQNSIDPYGDGGTTGIQANIRGCTNSSVGEMSGDTWLLPHLSYITSYVAAAAVPEPGTWAMMIVGFGLVGGAMRRTSRARPLAAA